MRVFRCITAREIFNMYKGISDRVGVVKGENTHKYEDGKDYIHFFRYSYDAEMFFKSFLFNMNQLDDFVIYMVANIPNEILEQYQGYGVYNYKVKHNVLENEYIPLCEYAIPVELFKPEYIVDVGKNIGYEYKSDEGEYNLYLDLIESLIKKNKSPISELKGTNISKVLGVIDDDRTELEILREKAEKFSKILKDLG